MEKTPSRQNDMMVGIVQNHLCKIMNVHSVPEKFWKGRSTMSTATVDHECYA